MAREGMQLIARGMGVEYAEARRNALAQVPLQRMLAPEEVGELAMYLCSDAAAGMTGQAVALCGGATMW